jgi:hypothetical protein
VQELVLVLLVLGVSPHGFGVTVEPAGLIVKPTVPAGALAEPPAVSVTVTVQLSGLFGEVESGQFRVVEVVRAVTLRLKVPELGLIGTFCPPGPCATRMPPE